MNQEIVDQFKPSFLRCVSNLQFLDTFYNHFLNASPEIEKTFEGINMERQKAMLNAALHQLMSLYEKQNDASIEHVKALGARHGSHGYQIPAFMYDIWLDSLLEAVSLCDPAFNESIEKAWREVMGFGIALMKKQAASPIQERKDMAVQEAVARIQKNLEESAHEASMHAESERDMEARAFQFGQYRAYLHAADLVRSLMRGMELKGASKTDR